MTRSLGIVLCPCAVALIAQSSKPQNPFSHDQIQYGPPPFGAPGATLGVIEGNPMGSSGDYNFA